MATMNKITEVLAAIKTMYPYYAKDTDVKVLARTWCAVLKEYPDEAVEAGLHKALQICKNPPTPADIIEQINNLFCTTSAEQLWGELTDILIAVGRQVSRFDYTFVEDNGLTQGQNARHKVEAIWDKLPKELKQYLGSYGEMLRLSRYTDDELKYEKPRFVKTVTETRKTSGAAMLGVGNIGLLEGGHNDY